MSLWSLLWGSSPIVPEPISAPTHFIPVEEDWVVVVDEDSETNKQLLQSSIFIPTLQESAVLDHPETREDLQTRREDTHVQQQTETTIAVIRLPQRAVTTRRIEDVVDIQTVRQR